MRKTGYLFSMIALLFLLSGAKVTAQCVTSPDDTICIGDSSVLFVTASGNAKYLWSTGDTTDTIVVKPTVTTTYYVTVNGASGELICNGDFEKGDTCFTSAYIYNPVNLGIEGQYAVVNNPFSVHGAWSQCTDHTSGAGKMMAINGAPQVNVGVWSEAINGILPNQPYNFSAWVTSVFPSSPAQLQFSINGAVVGPIFTATITPCQWQQFAVSWTSGLSPTATISIVNQNTATGGNDFALDDISFSTNTNCFDSVIVVVNPLPTANAGIDASICAGDTATLTATGGGTYEWNNTETTSLINISPTSTTTYTVTVTDKGCTDTDEAVVTINANPTANAGPDVAICIGETTQLTASGGSLYEWNTTESSSYIIVGPKITTTYTVTVTNVFGCKDTDEVVVTVNPLPTASFSPNPDETTLKFPIISFIDKSLGAAKWKWNFGDPSSSSNTSTLQFPSHTYSSVGVYTICLFVETSEGCKDTACGEIKIKQGFTFYAPNAFTPNGDGNNDGFKTEGTGIDSTHFVLSVYDRWGEELFSTADIKEPWNGKEKNTGKEVQEGVYTWLVFLNDLTGILHKFYGHVTLIR